MTTEDHELAVAAIEAWVRLDEAFRSFDAMLRRDFGVTGAQLALLRMIDEWGGAVTLAQLRARLSMHPATTGQLVERLRVASFTTQRPDPSDRRRKVIELTPHARDLLRRAPVAGPVRLRYPPHDAARLILLRSAFDTALEMFDLKGSLP